MINDGDSRLHYGLDEDVSKHRSKHDTIIPVEVRVGVGQRTIQQSWRVASDWQLRDLLESHKLEEAFDQIYSAYNAVTGGLGVKAMDHSQPLTKVTGDGNGELMISKIARYIGWARSVQQSQLQHAQAVDIIIFGKQFRTVDRERRQRRGKARENLIECLKLW